ncbi:hypothetical protein [Amycolatopsis sp. YIM 10]|uniref:hypothetical protein n=1 Tax=Amycolatopsis sp. YIM 10 TaxID=2653857 RepID=UPI001290587D|nr:hypothetical protein [Amycolatopsis sp. YIM 10]QFU90946.1 hypothetical protein YIM_28870 [Amycolatopsis sp. YIM 10]
MAQGKAKKTQVQKNAERCKMSEAEYTRVHGQATADKNRGKRTEPAAVAKLRTWGDCEGQTGLFPAPEQTGGTH